MLSLCLVDIIHTHVCAHMYTRMCFKGVNIARMRSSMPDTTKTVNLLLLLSSITVSSFEEEEEEEEKTQEKRRIANVSMMR
jgi:hypothetical protein